MAKLTRGERNIQWIETYCRIPEGKYVGQHVTLKGFQRDIVLGIYDGNVDGELIRQVIISFARKNAKTALSAFLCLLHIAGPEARPNSQLYSAAQSRDQAAILFNLAAKIVRMSPDLDEVIGIRDSVKEMFCPDLGTFYKALSADAKTKFGLSPVFIVHDELGQVSGPRSDLYEALETACAAQDQPLSIIISTQAPEDGDLLSILIDCAENNPDTKLFLYTAPEDLDPFCEETIKLANPAYDHFMNKKEVIRQATNAKTMPSQEPAYRNLILNQRIAREAPFVSPTIWKNNGEMPRDEDFERGVCLGLDLSSKLDLTALVAVAVGDDGKKSVKCEFFLPGEGIRDKSQTDRVPYDIWADQGYLTLCPGNKVSYKMVAERLIWWNDNFNLEGIDFDAWKIEELKTELKYLDGGEDLPFFEFRQGYKSMSPALDYLEGELVDGNIRHGNNPILTWNAANAVVDMDPTMGRKFNKKRATGRIDGMISLVMANFRSKIIVPDDEPFFMMI